jgi:hypothetical protein
VDLLSEIVTKEFSALMEVSDRLPSLPTNLLANMDGREPTASGTEEAATNSSVDNLQAEFGILRSAVILRVEGGGSQGAKFNEKYAYVADVCVTRFNGPLALLVAQAVNRFFEPLLSCLQFDSQIRFLKFFRTHRLPLRD